MSSFIYTKVAGIDLQLFAKRAAYSPLYNTLFIADTHFGKDATFRRYGFPVPVGSCVGTLDTISDLLAETHASQLVILGDMFHARSSLSREIVNAIESFFAQHSSLTFILVRGNHDLHVRDLPNHWPIAVVCAGQRMGQLALGHQPTQLPDGADLLLCGHVHPAIRASNSRESFGKLPCFWFSAGCLVFPAIGEFTGTHLIRPNSKDRVWLIAGDEIAEQATI